MLPFPVDIPAHHTQAVYVTEARTWQIADADPTPIRRGNGIDLNNETQGTRPLAPTAPIRVTIIQGDNKPGWIVGHKPLQVVYFAFDSTAINKADERALSTLPGGCYHIVAYADPRGTHDYNEKLSSRRAVVVANMISRKGQRPDAYGLGEVSSKPFSKDRRAEVYQCAK